MGEKQPLAQIEARPCMNGKHYLIKTPLELKGRGIKLERVLSSSDLTAQAQHLVGWNQYRVTLAAFSKLKGQYVISQETLLD